MTGSARDKKAGYGSADMDAVSDNPEWTEETTARSKSFDATFPDIAQLRRGQQKPLPKKPLPGV